jgi:beta-lactamase superfamily II metal-dependent hydrolase
VRAEPSSSAQIVGILRPGDRVTQIGSVPFWYQVRLEDGTEGWAAKAYLQAATPDPTPGATVAGIDLAKLRIHFIDVGVGDAILIDYEDREVFIDGGMGINIAWKYVTDRNLIQNPIELVVVTHGDTDHWKGLTRILGLEGAPTTPNFRAIEFWEPGYDRDCNQGTGSAQARQGFLDFISGARGKVHRFRRPLEATHTPLVTQTTPSLTGFVEIPELPGFKFLILHTDASPSGTTDCGYLINNASIVFKLVVGDHSFLFTGDANGKERTGPDQPGHVEAKLLQLEARLPGILKADVLKVPHHGSETASTSEFLNKVRPRFAIVSASTNHHLPRPTTLVRYDALGTIVLRTDQDRRSGNDHIVCFFIVQPDVELNCNYADVE